MALSLRWSGHDLDESDARAIVDADVDELPADAEMAVDHARMSSGDAVPHRTNPTELLDVEMDELASPSVSGRFRLIPRRCTLFSTLPALEAYVLGRCA